MHVVEVHHKYLSRSCKLFLKCVLAVSPIFSSQIAYNLNAVQFGNTSDEEELLLHSFRIHDL